MEGEWARERVASIVNSLKQGELPERPTELDVGGVHFKTYEKRIVVKSTTTTTTAEFVIGRQSSS